MPASIPETEAALGDEVAELMSATDTLFYAMRRARTSMTVAAGNAVSMSQLALLEPLIDTAELPIARLAEQAGVAAPTATRMLKQLDANGVVRRSRSEADERAVLISLTDRGRGHVLAVRAELRKRQVVGLRHLTAAQRQAMTATLLQLATIINRAHEAG